MLNSTFFKKMRKFPVVPRGTKIFDQSDFCISTVVFKFWGWAWVVKEKTRPSKVCLRFFVLCSRSWCVLVCELCAEFLARLCFGSVFFLWLRCSYFFSCLVFPSLFVVFVFVYFLLCFCCCCCWTDMTRWRRGDSDLCRSVVSLRRSYFSFAAPDPAPNFENNGRNAEFWLVENFSTPGYDGKFSHFFKNCYWSCMGGAGQLIEKTM